MPGKFRLLLIFLFGLTSFPALAQDSLKFVPGSPYYSEFCVLFRKIAQMGPDQMLAMADGPASVDSSIWAVKDAYNFPGARYGMIRNKPAAYRAVVMVRDSKDELRSSYNNLVHQVQDCLVEQAYVKGKKFLNKDLYSTVIIPAMAEEMPYGLEVQVAIEFNLRTLMNELVLIITPASGGN